MLWVLCFSLEWRNMAGSCWPQYFKLLEKQCISLCDFDMLVPQVLFSDVCKSESC